MRRNMGLRITLARFLVRFGRFIQSLALMVMRPDDLVEFGRQTYDKADHVESWSSDEIIESGLDRDEAALLEKIRLKDGKLLLLGVGGGREAIYLAKKGFEVTGVDFSEGMVKSAQENAARRGLTISGIVQEISQLDVSENSYDIVWLSSAMYSSIPTSNRRLMMLQRISKALKPGGYFICQFHWDTKMNVSLKGEFIRKVIAFLTLGNLQYEKGDMLWHNLEFIHAFSSEQDLQSEFQEAQFKVEYIQTSEENIRGGAVLIKDETQRPAR
jgi:ubiquinone/menaquinone biosynthesis C-methylase UbiE